MQTKTRNAIIPYDFLRFPYDFLARAGASKHSLWEPGHQETWASKDPLRGSHEDSSVAPDPAKGPSRPHFQLCDLLSGLILWKTYLNNRFKSFLEVICSKLVQ